MFKVVEIEGKKIPMMSNGGTLREYRHFFKRDLLGDLIKIEKGLENGDLNTEVFQDIAWTLAHRANAQIEPIEEWARQFDNTLSILESFDQIMDLIIGSNTTIVKPKKKHKKMKNK